MYSASHYCSDKEGGFTLVELLVSISIIVIITSFVVAGQDTYVGGAALKGDLSEIALSLSEARAYGLGVRELTPGSGDFSAAYGIEFRLPSAGGSDSSYVSFADLGSPKDGVYGGTWACSIGGGSECLSKKTFSRNNKIDSICVIYNSGGGNCAGDNVDRVAVSFLRPDTEAIIKFFNNGGLPFTPSNYKGVEINLEAPSGDIKSVSVFTTGQISIQ